MHDSLRKAMTKSHRVLRERFDLSAKTVRGNAATGEVIRATDDFLINMCRHISATCEVILPAARTRLPAGRQRVKEYVRQAKLLERKIAQTKHRLYGESHAIHVPWSQVWAELSDEFDHLIALEHTLISDLAPVVGSASDYQQRLADAEASSPTRPHPHSLHTGPLSHLSRNLWAKADSFWNTAEGRIVTVAVTPAEKIAA